ncbi:MAG: hypothetical protein LBI18_12375 [Planctomycetaceae bacterium]|jgi:hypothetical protein|nr:hypothetical protein [Planctomycetaceae bacterium]
MQISIYTRGQHNDNTWKPQAKWNDINAYLSDTNGLLVYRQDNDLFSVYAVSEPSEKRDYQNRLISIGLLFSDCSEIETRKLTTFCLSNWGQLCVYFTAFIENFGSDRWNINIERLSKFVNRLPVVEDHRYVFLSRYENDNTADTRKKLCNEMKQCTFSDGKGLKLVVTEIPLTGSAATIIRSQVDRYFWCNGIEKTLAAKTTKTTETKKRVNVEPKKETILDWLHYALIVLIMACMLSMTTFYNLVYLPLNTDVNTLQTNLKKVKMECDDLKTEHNEYKDKNNKYEMNIDQLKNHLNTSQENYKKIETECNEYKNEINRLTVYINNMNISPPELNKEIQNLQIQKQNLTLEIKNLNTEQNEMITYKNSLSDRLNKFLSDIKKIPEPIRKILEPQNTTTENGNIIPQGQ